MHISIHIPILTSISSYTNRKNGYKDVESMHEKPTISYYLSLFWLSKINGEITLLLPAFCCYLIVTPL